MERRRSLALFLVGTVALGLASAAPVAATEPDVQPRVINGDLYPPLSGAAVALETSFVACSASLWKPGIAATAAHCLEDEAGNIVAPEDITLWPPGADTSGPPAAVKVTDIVVDDTWLTYADDDDEATARDLAFLVLNQPLGAPAWTRMATPMEAAALTWNSARAEFVGYGQTSPTVDPNATLDALPGGLVSRLTWGYNTGLGTFRVPGDGERGTCKGDSGGPWMSRLGNEILYLGPLSYGQGLPCDKPEPPNDTYEEGPVASANTDLVDVALATAGESATDVPRTCIKGDDIKRQCWDGRAWEYEYCWDVKRAELWKWQKGDKWKRVDRFTGTKEVDYCGKKSPYLITFRGIETKKNTWYEVYLPKQKGSDQEAFDPFKVTVS